MEEEGEGRSSQRKEDTEPTRMAQKMDKDFLMFLTYAPVTYRNVKEQQDRKLCREWLRKLSQRQPHTVPGKRNRNLFLVNLILQMGDGKLSEPFNSSPPQEKLGPPGQYFPSVHPPQPCTEDLNPDIEDSSEVSKDGRMYFASKSLPDGRGAMAYIGLSSGGGDTVWLDSQGQEICSDLLDTSRAAQREPDTGLEGALSDRTPPPDRNGLYTFYQGLLNQINEMIQTYGTCKEPTDQVIHTMIEDLQMEEVSDGRLLPESISCYTRLHWLQELQQKIQAKLDTATLRELELSRLEEEATRKDEIHFLDMSHSVSSPRADTMFSEAARDRPSVHSIQTLNKYYPQCIVHKLLVLLEKEKLKMIYQERSIYQDFILELKSEILTLVRNRVDKYMLGRMEWRRVMLLMRQIEEAKSKILAESERAVAAVDPDFHDKESVLHDELARAKRKLEEGKGRSEEIETRIALLHEQLHSMALDFDGMKAEGRREEERLRLEICHLQKEIRQQERKLSNLRATLNVKHSEADCAQGTCNRTLP